MALLRRTACGLLAWFFMAGAALADYPDRPVRMVVPYAPGGPTDVVARIFAEQLNKQLSASFIVENRPGANAVVGADMVAKAPADGYTLLFTGGSSLTPVFTRNLPFELMKAFTPVSLVYNGTLYIFLNADVPAKTLPELIAYSKANPGKVNYASNAGTVQILGAVMQKQSGMDILVVPYKGAGPATTAVVANESQFTITALQAFKPHVDAGKVRIIALLAKTRSPLTPDVPTVVESGHPELVAGFATGVWAPFGTPADAIAKLNRAINAVAAMPEVRERVRPLVGADPQGSTPEGFRQVVQDEINFYANAAKLANYEPQ
ncbi:MAG TPA: tripartite tricarboxylate transporter substrate-binding protein [Burkholderiales bacterium]|nr:tripartite tricarboxylate transporter substrate-binding protein [Burkholderiales bacterium]